MATLQELKKSTICHMIIAISFFSCGLLCNIVQLLLLILVKPFDPKLFRKLLYYPCYALYSQLICVTEWYGGGKLRLYMDSEDLAKFAGKEHGLMIMNHSYEIDWLCAWMMLDKLQILGTSKAFAKKAIRYMPVLGWAWWMAEFVFLNRDFDKDKEIIAKQLKQVYSYPDPVWVLLTAEGTRFSAAKHEVSLKFAHEKGMTPLKHHLIPRTRGFTASLPTLRGICPAIYDINLVFKRDSKVPVNLNSILSGQPVEPYIYVRRFALDQVPEDEKEAAEWLQKLYIEKDRIIDSFHETGSFFQNSGIKEVPCVTHKPRLCSLLNFIIIGSCSISIILYYLVSALLGANWFGLIAISSIFLGFYLLLEKANNMSKISKASSYGVKSKAN